KLQARIFDRISPPSHWDGPRVGTRASSNALLHDNADATKAQLFRSVPRSPTIVFRARKKATSRNTIPVLMTTINASEFDGEMMTPMPPANNKANRRTPARILVLLLRAATASCGRRRSAALDGTASTRPHSPA